MFQNGHLWKFSNLIVLFFGHLSKRKRELGHLIISIHCNILYQFFYRVHVYMEKKRHKRLFLYHPLPSYERVSWSSSHYLHIRRYDWLLLDALTYIVKVKSPAGLVARGETCGQRRRRKRERKEEKRHWRRWYVLIRIIKLECIPQLWRIFA